MRTAEKVIKSLHLDTLDQHPLHLRHPFFPSSPWRPEQLLASTTESRLDCEPPHMRSWYGKMTYSTNEITRLSWADIHMVRCALRYALLNDRARRTDESSATARRAHVPEHMRRQSCTAPEAHTHPQRIVGVVHARRYPSACDCADALERRRPRGRRGNLGICVRDGQGDAPRRRCHRCHHRVGVPSRHGAVLRCWFDYGGMPGLTGRTKDVRGLVVRWDSERDATGDTVGGRVLSLFYLLSDRRTRQRFVEMETEPEC